MFDDPEPPISRRELLTEALPRGLAGLARGALQLREDLSDQLADAIAPRPGLSPELAAVWQEVQEAEERMRREHPEWFPDDLPDCRDRNAVLRWIDEREEERRRRQDMLADRAGWEEAGEG